MSQVAGSGGEAVILVESFRPDVVILELLLPDMSGIETGRIIKGSSKDTQIILCSSFYPPQKISDWGVDAFVLSDLGRLKETVRKLIF